MPREAAETAGEEKREPRSRRGRGNRRPREARPETAANANGSAPHAVIEIAGYRAIVEVARKPAPAPKPAPAADVAPPAQQALQLDAIEAPSAPQPGAVTASPATILAELASSKADLQQVETRTIASETVETGAPARARRRRRPAVDKKTEPISLLQVETVAAPTSPAEDTAALVPPHPTRRRPRPQSASTDEPLVQVETQGS